MLFDEDQLIEHDFLRFSANSVHLLYSGQLVVNF